MDIDAEIAQARKDGRAALDEQAGKRILARFGLAVPKTAVAAGPDDAVDALDGLSLPVVVKVMSPEILHKSDAGGVAVGLDSADAVRDAIERMLDAPGIAGRKLDGFLIEEMAPTGQEIVIGGVHDPQFGPMIMVGLGGIFVEVLADVAFRICPITEADARGMLDELRGAPLLDGVRGQAAASRDAIVDALLKVGGEDGLLLSLRDEVAELDVNPLIVSESAAVAVDARFVLAEDGGAAAGDGGGGQDEELVESFKHLFAPKTVAVIGASSSGVTIANTFITRMRDFGYEGAIYPIHPKASKIEGLTAYPSLAEMPEAADYCYIAIGAERVPEILSGAAGRVRFAQVISSGFAEVSHGVELERSLVLAARAGGCRVLGPNCLGLYSPRGHRRHLGRRRSTLRPRRATNRSTSLPRQAPIPTPARTRRS